ncbi:hypothetical protein Tco_0703285 [Tanacetum coccineum]|uniref:Uncharacterized protein n=1 Tax=Tanacetum coccineum TaxID=301880 RepID=A0ABQ4XZ01_9ASTR
MGKAVDANLVITESSGTKSKVQDDSSRSGNDTGVDDTDIRPIYDDEPMVEVQLTAEYNIFATGQHHTEQLEIIIEAQIQKKVFAITALKNDVRKLKGNSVDTKFAKTSVSGKPVLQSLRNQSVVRQPNAFKSERPQMSKSRFASQVDVNNNLSRPVTQHYLPKRSESAFSKSNHMIASSSSRNSSKNMPRFSSNNMVHNHYLDEVKKKTQERDRNSKTSVMPAVRFQITVDDSKPKPRSTNHSTRSLLIQNTLFVLHVISVFNANHDACTTNFLKEVNSRVKIQSNKTRNSNKPVEHKCHTQKPSVVAEKSDISETSVEVDSKLIRKMTFEQNGSILAPQRGQRFLQQNIMKIKKVNDRVVSKSIEKIKLFQSLPLLLLLMHPININNNKIQLHLLQLSQTTITADGNFDL